MPLFQYCGADVDAAFTMALLIETQVLESLNQLFDQIEDVYVGTTLEKYIGLQMKSIHEIRGHLTTIVRCAGLSKPS